MPADSQYELLDFGDGRKLERFAGIVLNRPCPTADGIAKSRPDIWENAVARFRGPRMGDGSWSPSPKNWLPADWHYAHGEQPRFKLQLEALPSGQIGVFPEQRENWNWIAVRTACGVAKLGRPLKVLNLFAYTGGSTLAAAAAG